MDSFECVLALAESKNMTKASESLFLSQPALTLRIQRLEKELGITIFDRSTRPISITPEGQTYIREMTRIRNEEAKLKYKLREMTGNKKEIVRIGIGINRGRYWLPDLLPMLMEQFPDIDFQFQEAPDQDIERMIREDELDYGISGSFSVIDGLSYQEIGKEKIYIGVPADSAILSGIENLRIYDLNHPYPLEISALNGQTLILGRNSFGLTRYIHMLFSMFRITPGKIINISNGETSYQLAARGLGITFMFSSYHVSHLKDETKRPIPCVLKDFPMQRTVYFVSSVRHSDSQMTESIFQSVVSYMKAIDS